MRRRARTMPSAIRISDWDDATVVCDLCGRSWVFASPDEARSWMGEHRRVHQA